MKKAYAIASNPSLPSIKRIRAIEALKTTGVQHFDGNLKILAVLQDDLTLTDKSVVGDVILFTQKRQAQLTINSSERVGNLHRIAKDRIRMLISRLTQKKALSNYEKGLLEQCEKMKIKLEKMDAALARKIEQFEQELHELKMKKSPTEKDLRDIAVGEIKLAGLKKMSGN